MTQPPQWPQDPQYGAPQPWNPLDPTGGRSPASRRRLSRKWIGGVAVVGVVAAGGTVVAIAATGSDSAAGSDSPQEAVTKVVDSLNRSDLVGALNGLPPGERDSLRRSIEDSDEHLDVVAPDGELSDVSGVTVTFSGLEWGSETQAINDRVQLVNLIGGTLEVSGDLSAAPLTETFLDTLFPGGVPSDTTSARTVDLTDLVQDSQPVRVAAQSIGGRWYASLGYTIADQIAQRSGSRSPSPGDRIEPRGAASPEKAVEEFVEALGTADATRVIELMSPADASAIHDYGGLLVSGVEPMSNGFGLDNVTFERQDVDGGVRLAFRSAAFEYLGRQGTVTLQGQCAVVNGESQYDQCGADLGAEFFYELGDSPGDAYDALGRLFSDLPSYGVVTQQVGGSWFISPIRTAFGLADTGLPRLTDGTDLEALYELVARMND